MSIYKCITTIQFEGGYFNMKQSQKLQVFKENHLFKKKEIQKSFQNFVEHIQNSDEEEYSEAKRQKILELCERFKDALDKCNLPEMKDDWWYYQYNLTNDGIDLALSFCEELEVDSDGEIISMTASEEFIFLNIKCDYLTVEQYAKDYNVTPTTVRQWIRRGKLRSAKKIGRDWLIPSIADKPKRGFESVTYHWGMLPKTVSEEFPFLADNFSCIYIFQDEEDKSKFHCIMGYPGSHNREKITLNTQEREKLELSLISNPAIQAEELSSSIMFMPSKE